MSGFTEGKPLFLHHEIKYVATLAATEAMISSIRGIHLEARCLFLMEWTTTP
jgi:hypothetical protein